MTNDPADDDPADEAPLNIFDTLLSPLRMPGRVVSNIETLAGAVVALQSETNKQLSSVDDGIRVLVEKLDSLEEAITTRLDGLRSDVNERMGAVEKEVSAMRPAMDQMAHDVQKIDGLLPNASDGPLTRLKDTLSPGS